MFRFCLLVFAFMGSIDYCLPVCVLESDFGFAVNCNFKKSGLFRIRNLGGAKLQFGLGFSLGDELGFPESLGNVEAVRKRSLDVQSKSGEILDLKTKFHDDRSSYQPRDYMASQKNFMTVPSPNQQPIVALTPQAFKKRPQQLMTEAQSLPLGVPPFRKLTSPNLLFHKGSVPPNNKVPEFQALPSSITTQQLVQPTKIEYFPKEKNLPEIDLKGHTVEELAAIAGVSQEYIRTAIKIKQQQMMKDKFSTTTTKPNFTTFQTSTSSTKNMNVDSTSTEKVNGKPTSKILDKTKESSSKQHVLKKKTASKKVIKYGQKVMNAPKEYYPVGYDKNFDDNFKSKIDLPVTSFNCGDQRHFPGLYADEDLGCMVFHVCALTDDGLVMKSFLCPESTLFDQSILKCNWWFYTDCKSSKSLFDSNLPVSKSYQLMKSLSYFNNNYKSPQNTTSQVFKEESDIDIKGSLIAASQFNNEKNNEKVSIVMAKDSEK